MCFPKCNVCDIFQFFSFLARSLFAPFALDGTEDDTGLGRRGRRSRRRRRRRRADRQRVRDRQRRRGRRVAELSRAFKQTVLFRTNKSYKVNDQRCLSFVYSFTDIYLHSHFSLALFIWEIWKSYILLRENTRL